MRKSSVAFNAISVVQSLLYLNTAVWLLLGVLTLLRLSDNNVNQIVGISIIALLMFGNAGAMLVVAWLLGKRQKRFYLFALTVLLVNIILTFTDQFGMADLVTLIIDLVILGLLIIRYTDFTKTAVSP